LGKEFGYPGCGKERWLANKSLRLCTICNEKRKQEKKGRKGPPKIKQESEKLRLANQIYRAKRKEFLADPKNARCAVFAWRAANQIHHKRGRGKYLNDETTWLAVSAEGHDKIEANPGWAIDNGFSELRGAKY
jgi:hypothetical protein